MAAPSPHEPSGVTARITSHALDVLLKLEAEQLAYVLPRRFGLPMAPVRRHLPTELPQLDLHLERLDSVFELMDGTILNLEIQADLTAEDLARFVGYGLALLRVYKGRPVRTVVICGPRVRQAPPPIDLGLVSYRLDCVLIGDQDGDATLARLHALAQSGRPWDEADRLDLLLLPLMRHVRDTEAVVREGLTLATALPAVEQPQVVGALLALAYHYEGKAVLDRLAEGLMTTSIWELLFAEQLKQGMEQGRARGLAEGLAEGRAAGRVEGRVEGERVMLRRYLERRFGAIPPALEERIAASDADAITALFDQALAATAIETL